MWDLSLLKVTSKKNTCHSFPYFRKAFAAQPTIVAVRSAPMAIQSPFVGGLTFHRTIILEMALSMGQTTAASQGEGVILYSVGITHQIANCTTMHKGMPYQFTPMRSTEMSLPSKEAAGPYEIQFR